MVRRALFSAIILSSLALVGGFVLLGSVDGAVCSLLVGLLWLTLEYFQRHWIAAFGLIAVVILAILGAIQEYYAFFHALAVAAALSAWDLSRFRQRLLPTKQDEAWHVAERRHLQRLLIVNGVGLGLAFLAIGLRFVGSFYLEWLLALLMLFVLFALVIWLARLTR